MFSAPLRELRFVMHELLASAPVLGAAYAEIGYSAELADNIAEEAAKFAEEVLAPINASGDREGARWTPDGVVMPKGFRAAYSAYVEAGWAQLSIGTALGGQGMPQLVNTAVEELMFAANMSFFLGTSLARGAVDAIAASATEEQKATLLPRLVTGEWMGTMNLTEPQAGSDLALLRTRAVAEADHYRLYGQKIFITYGEHDLAENIIHLVLARIDGAPEGVKGISLFCVPKLLVNADGSLGERNDLRCISIEHKLGIHASPTCVMSFGEKDGAVGYLLGPPHAGLSFMFIMMNAARLSVGVQGLAQSERAWQSAQEWARNRLQGRVDGKPAPVAIVEHPDVRRMLLSMKARTEAMRALCSYAALELDKGHRLGDAAQRKSALARAELLVPVVKGWCTETAIDVTSTGVQVHGGMGYIEETGVAQHLRDVRIASIYEGTTGIQSNDLIGRKLARDRGAAMNALIKDLLAELNASRALGVEAKAARNGATEGLTTLRDATESLLRMHAESPPLALAVAVPYLKLCGLVISGCLMARAAMLAEAALAANAGDVFYQAKLVTCRFYADQVLPEALGLARVVKGGAASVTEARSELI
ncbi:MAG TPA: acyl-CoA dehydrogenase [Steroidobacteraceae bacterium]|nr:acyl-CoA dehydrogenase [Steroidobacteraceae bacterium]